MARENTQLLTPEHVGSAAFSSARLGRRGLDEGEVRAFCHWVADGLGRLLSEHAELQAEVLRLRERVLQGDGSSGARPKDAHVQAVYVLSRAQQTADRYVADAHEYSREIAEEAHKRHEEILREAKMRAGLILDEAHAAASQAASAAHDARGTIADSERQKLEAELTYLRAFSDVCRTHLRAYMASLARSIEEWERAEHERAFVPKGSILSAPLLPSP